RVLPIAQEPAGKIVGGVQVRQDRLFEAGDAALLPGSRFHACPRPLRMTRLFRGLVYSRGQSSTGPGDFCRRRAPPEEAWNVAGYALRLRRLRSRNPMTTKVKKSTQRSSSGLRGEVSSVAVGTL